MYYTMNYLKLYLMLNCAFTVRLVYSLRFLIKLFFLGFSLKSSNFPAISVPRAVPKTPELDCISSFNQCIASIIRLGFSTTIGYSLIVVLRIRFLRRKVGLILSSVSKSNNNGLRPVESFIIAAPL
jgi:hypothetical protein